MLNFLIPLMLVILVLLRFRRRFKEEFDRQSRITWPTSAAIFETRPLALEKHGQPGSPTTTNLETSYSFYTQGEAYTGKRLLPELILLPPEEEDQIERKLNEQGRTWRVKYNPENPSENMLSVGHGGLSWNKLLVYAFFGVLLPGGFVVAILAYLTDPAAWWEAVTFGSLENPQNS